MKRLNIQARGLIKGGYCNYDIEPGSVSYQGQVVIGILFFTKTIPFQGNVPIPVSLLPSAFVQGADLVIGPAKVHVALVSGTVAQVLLQMDGVGSGTGLVDLSGQQISIKQLDVKGTVSGHDVEIYATEA